MSLFGSSEQWPGYPYKAALPVDYSKVGCPGIKIHNSGKITVDSAKSKLSDDEAYYYKMLKDIENMAKGQRITEPNQKWKYQTMIEPGKLY